MAHLLFKKGETPLKFYIEQDKDAVYIAADYMDKPLQLKLENPEFISVMEMDKNEIFPLYYFLIHLLHTLGQTPSPYIQKKYGEKFINIINNTITELKEIYEAVKL